VPLYAAYGSNMDPTQMAKRAPHSPMVGAGWLVGTEGRILKVSF